MWYGSVNKHQLLDRQHFKPMRSVGYLIGHFRRQLNLMVTHFCCMLISADKTCVFFLHHFHIKPSCVLFDDEGFCHLSWISCAIIQNRFHGRVCTKLRYHKIITIIQDNSIVYHAIVADSLWQNEWRCLHRGHSIMKRQFVSNKYHFHTTSTTTDSEAVRDTTL